MTESLDTNRRLASNFNKRTITVSEIFRLREVKSLRDRITTLIGALRMIDVKDLDVIYDANVRFRLGQILVAFKAIDKFETAKAIPPNIHYSNETPDSKEAILNFEDREILCADIAHLIDIENGLRKLVRIVPEIKLIKFGLLRQYIQSQTNDEDTSS